MIIFYHPKFRRMYKKLPINIQLLAEEKEWIFRLDVFDSRLNTHKLYGKLKHQWSFDVDNKNRIIFEFDEENVIFLAIGDHSVYR
ncbi:MAG: type II toxin-antitoxin system mRNA interferase toxin, RelE/StbE family [Candidatus Vogelbacteria bacterium]|nr:type II toxin-antitoxin system mRNA interferase toxin, RelE/StbE family [Candidatus Vogelbacteria bacterium]